MEGMDRIFRGTPLRRPPQHCELGPPGQRVSTQRPARLGVPEPPIGEQTDGALYPLCPERRPPTAAVAAAGARVRGAHRQDVRLAAGGYSWTKVLLLFARPRMSKIKRKGSFCAIRVCVCKVEIQPSAASVGSACDSTSK